MSQAAAIDWVLTHQGFVLNDGGALDQMARETWCRWWEQWTPPTPTEGRRHVEQWLARPRPVCTGGESTRTVVAGPRRATRYAWVRTADHVTTNGSDFPWHSSPAQMGEHLATWTNPHAIERELCGVCWVLTERPGGWAGTIGMDGNHRAVMAAAAGLPLILVSLGEVIRATGGPFELDDPTPARQRPIRPGSHPLRRALVTRERWSEQAMATVDQLASEGLCARPDWTQLGDRRRSRPPASITLAWASAELAWVVSEKIHDTRARQKILTDRFPTPCT